MPLDDTTYNAYKINDPLYEHFVKKEESEEIACAINQLTEKQQKVIRMKFYEELTNKEIALVMGVDKSAITHCVQRGLNKLKEILPNIN
ncbi:MAG: sigma-70 family RNA polymerase sigma factor [Defluviitaleaceae bacterium]|nr:sigma-70 family RNA polymerase sigma factor [Defluviitaleaceae bacterium]